MKKALAVLIGLSVALSVFGGGTEEAAQDEGRLAVSLTAHTAKGKAYDLKQLREAPGLAELVKKGEVPPVVGRLPKDPLVLEPTEKVGRYGGTFVNSDLSLTGGWDTRAALEEPMLIYDTSLKAIVPNVAKAYKLSDDQKTMTLWLREGMKWSDGQPFTADDVVFYFEDCVGNDKIFPKVPAHFRPGGKRIQAVKIGEYQVELRSAIPLAVFPDLLAYPTRGMVFAPKHYLQQFHIKYNPDADAKAKALGFKNWWEVAVPFQDFLDRLRQPRHHMAYPTLSAWILYNIDGGGNKYWKRNPYYFKIDPEGRQLPYLDELSFIVMQDRETMTLKWIAGETSYQGMRTVLADYPVYQENAAKAGYEVRLYRLQTTSRHTYAFNMTTKDPAYRKLFEDVRFREAMSLAINRDEINKLFYFGKGVIHQATIDDNASFYEDWMGSYMTEYNPARAIQLLDEMGLKKGKEGLRTLPNGTEIAITLIWAEAAGPARVLELVSDYWAKIGVRVIPKELERTFHSTAIESNDVMMSSWNHDQTSEVMMRQNPVKFSPELNDSTPFGTEWAKWYASNGKEGEEPPGDIKDLATKIRKWQSLPVDHPDYVRLGKEIVTTHVKALWRIGTVGYPPQPVLVKKGLKNVPPTGTLYALEYGFTIPFQVSTWFWDK